jgi:hypothetical protein
MIMTFHGELKLNFLLHILNFRPRVTVSPTGVNLNRSIIKIMVFRRIHLGQTTTFRCPKSYPKQRALKTLILLDQTNLLKRLTLLEMPINSLTKMNLTSIPTRQQKFRQYLQFHLPRQQTIQRKIPTQAKIRKHRKKS